MKIAIISSGFLPVVDGVTVTAMARLAKLSERGHEVVLFCPDYSALESVYPNWREYTGTLFPNVRIVHLPSGPFAGVEFERNVTISAHAALTRELETFEPDIIHVDEPERLFVGLWRTPGIEYARRKNIPCVGFFHTNFIEYLEDFFPLPRPILGTLEFIVRRIVLFTYNAYDATLVSSSTTAEKSRCLGIKNTVVGEYLGFEASKFDPAHREPNFFARRYGLRGADERTKLLFLGRLTPDKGWNFTLAALTAGAKTLPLDQYAILVAGDGELRDTIKRRLGALSPHVHMLGRVPPDDVPSLMANADVHVTTSEKETRGLTILEAFASGIPVLAPRAGGVVESITDGHDGFLFEPRNRADFLAKLVELADHADLRTRMGRAGQETVRHLTWDHAVTNLEATWTRLVAESKARTSKDVREVQVEA